MDHAIGNESITKLLFDKYKTLYSSVKTSNKNVTIMEIRNFSVTPSIIKKCIRQHKPGKDDGCHGFNSNHLIHSSHRLYVSLIMLFNVMLMHGYSAKD